jgi:predicted RNase H-like nuclease (RuvC/YqgF family)
VTLPEFTDALGQAQQRFTDAQSAMLRAEQRAEGARIEVTRATAAVSAHGNVAERLAAWNANQLRAELGPTDMPDDLADARRRLAASQEELRQAERMLQQLDHEARQLRLAANAAGAELRALMKGVSTQQAETDATPDLGGRP